MSNPAYPTVFIAKDSKRSTRDGRSEDQIGDGSTRVRKLFADKFDFDVHHPMATNTELSALQSFYAANLTSPAIDFTWVDGTVYPVLFGKGGLVINPTTPGRWDVRVRLAGV